MLSTSRTLITCKLAYKKEVKATTIYSKGFKMLDLGKRVKGLRKDQGWTQLDLSKRTNLSRGRIAQIETNPLAEVKGDTLVSLAKAFGYSTEQLISDDELGLLKGLKLQPITKKLPVISWSSLPSIIKGSFEMGDNDQFVGCPYDIGDNSFALEVKNDVMTSPNGRSYNKGTLIFIDQTKTPKTGDRVIAINTFTDESVFREYVLDGGVKYLKPLNVAYPIQQFNEYTKIIGVIVGSYTAE